MQIASTDKFLLPVRNMCVKLFWEKNNKAGLEDDKKGFSAFLYDRSERT